MHKNKVIALAIMLFLLFSISLVWSQDINNSDNKESLHLYGMPLRIIYNKHNHSIVIVWVGGTVTFFDVLSDKIIKQLSIDKEFIRSATVSGSNLLLTSHNKIFQIDMNTMEIVNTTFFEIPPDDSGGPLLSEVSYPNDKLFCFIDMKRTLQVYDIHSGKALQKIYLDYIPREYYRLEDNKLWGFDWESFQVLIVQPDGLKILNLINNEETIILDKRFFEKYPFEKINIVSFVSRYNILIFNIEDCLYIYNLEKETIVRAIKLKPPVRAFSIITDIYDNILMIEYKRDISQDGLDVIIPIYDYYIYNLSNDKIVGFTDVFLNIFTGRITSFTPIFSPLGDLFFFTGIDFLLKYNTQNDKITKLKQPISIFMGKGKNLICFINHEEIVLCISPDINKYDVILFNVKSGLKKTLIKSSTW